MNYSVKVHDSFDTLPLEWPNGGRDEPYRAHHHVFQTKAFLQLWWDTFGGDTAIRLCLVEVRDPDGQPLLFIPLCITTRWMVRLLSFVDAGTADYNAPVLFPSPLPWTRQSAEEMWRAVRLALPPHDVVQLENMPDAVGDLVNPLGLLADGPNDVSCHGTNLRRPWQDIDRELPARKTLLKKMRGLERIGPVRFDVADSDAERGELIAKLLLQKQRRFEDTNVPGFDADPRKEAFFQNGIDIFARQGMLHLCGLRVGDEIVATAFGLVQGRHYYGLMIGFEAGEWASYSVGRILYYRIAQWLHARDFAFMDLGIGDEPWKLQHSDTTIALSQKRQVLTSRGRAFDRWDHILTRMRAMPLWQKLRPFKWIALRAIRRVREPLGKKDRQA